MRSIKSIRESINLIKRQLSIVAAEGDAERVANLLKCLDADKNALIVLLEQTKTHFLLFSDDCPDGRLVDAKTYAVLLKRMSRADRATHQVLEVDETDLSIFEKFSA